MVEAAISIGTQSTNLPENDGIALMAGCADVANMMGHISDVFQWPVTVEPQICPMRSNLTSIPRTSVAFWVTLST